MIRLFKDQGLNQSKAGHQQKPIVSNTIWAVGGGKGGVGKSFISSSLAICLARMGKTVTLIDLDLGGANLHTCLGQKINLKPNRRTLSDFLKGTVQNINELLEP